MWQKHFCKNSLIIRQTSLGSANCKQFLINLARHWQTAGCESCLPPEAKPPESDLSATRLLISNCFGDGKVREEQETWERAKESNRKQEANYALAFPSKEIQKAMNCLLFLSLYWLRYPTLIIFLILEKKICSQYFANVKKWKRILMNLWAVKEDLN